MRTSGCCPNSPYLESELDIGMVCCRCHCFAEGAESEVLGFCR
jgi:hypothetical protein